MKSDKVMFWVAIALILNVFIPGFHRHHEIISNTLGVLAFVFMGVSAYLSVRRERQKENDAADAIATEKHIGADAHVSPPVTPHVGHGQVGQSMIDDDDSGIDLLDVVIAAEVIDAVMEPSQPSPPVDYDNDQPDDRRNNYDDSPADSYSDSSDYDSSDSGGWDD